MDAPCLRAAAAACILLAASAWMAAQSRPAPVPPTQAPAAGASNSLVERYTAPIEIFKTGLGPFTRPISSSNAAAQAFFSQGFQMMYAFAKPEAVRSFREAWKRDPECAICFWGEAWAWGSYLNGPMS